MAQKKKNNINTNFGRPKAIKDPETLWNLFVGYKKQVKSNPFQVTDYVGKDGNPVIREKEKPLLIEGFACYVADNHDGIDFPDINRYLDNSKKDACYADFVTVATRIKMEIREDQIGGGMAGMYNQSLTAKLNHLVDRQETKQVTSVRVLNVDPLAAIETDEDQNDLIE